MRLVLRTLFALTLLLGSGAADWMPTEAHEACCCGTAAGGEDPCPCPKPESNRTPQRGACTERQAIVALQAERHGEQGQRRAERRREPATWVANPVAVASGNPCLQVRGRDPDLGRHLARLSTFRI